MKHKILFKTPHSCVTVCEYVEATMRGLVMFVDTDNVLRFKEPTKFNPNWFPSEHLSTTRPKPGDTVNVDDRGGWILFIEQNEVHVKFLDGEIDSFDLDNFMFHTSKGRRTIWNI